MPTIEAPEQCFAAESIAQSYFPRLSAGAKVNGIALKVVRNNESDKFDIDWAIINENEADPDKRKIAVVDTEYKPGWKDGPGYPYFSIARYTMKYNKGLTDIRNETIKVRYYKMFSDRSFWMAIRADYKYAGIVIGGIIISSPIKMRPRPAGMVRDIETFDVSRNHFVFCDPFSTDIEDYILGKLEEAKII